MRKLSVRLSAPTFFLTVLFLPFCLRAQANTNAPSIVTEPMSLSVHSGDSASFSVQAVGAGTLRYQWRVNNTNYVGATNASLFIASVRIFNGGTYQVVVSNSFGSVTSQVATLAVDEDLTFRILELRTNAVMIVDHNALTGNDRGGIAVSGNNVFITGDGVGGTPRTARFPISTLVGGTVLSTAYDAMFSNLRTEKVYTLGNGSTPISYAGFNLNFTTINSLLEIDGDTGALTGGRINLSLSIPINLSGNCGIFSGYDRVVVYNASRVFDISLPSGVVTDMGTMSSPPHSFSESWCYWGIAEYFNNALHLVYVQNSITISRRRVPGATTVTLGSFLNLSDMASITFSLSQGRWYFHHQRNSQFGGSPTTPSEILGCAKASYTLDAGHPLILTNPVSQSVYIDSNAVLRVTAVGAAPLSYQWLFNGVEIPDATNSVLLLRNVQPADGGNYRVRVSNLIGDVASSTATLTVITTPFIVAQPQNRSIFRGSNVTFSVVADGAPTLQYQWRFNNANLPGATNSTLLLTNVQTNQSGFYSVLVTNRFGFLFSTNAELFVIVPADDGSVFQITALQTNPAQTVETYNVFEDYEYGPLAASSNSLFFSSFSATARANIEPLGVPGLIGRYYFALLSNLRTEIAYALGDAAAPFGSGGGTATTLWELNATSGATTGNRSTLSSAIPNVRQSSQVGFFSGFDRAVVLNGSRAYNIALPSGMVTDFGPMVTPVHAISLGGSFWGVAEHFGGVIYLVYARNNQTIVRTRVSDGMEFTPYPNFLNLSSYMASITVSVRRNRWYFHHLIGSQFTTVNNATLGSVPASFNINTGANIDHFQWEPLASLQTVNVPMTVTLTARNTSNNIAANFNGTVTLSGVNVASGAPVAISPVSISGFVGGVWTGQVTVLQPASGMYLRADDRDGHVGNSAALSVSPTNDLAVTITDRPDPVVLGNPLTYTITVTNTGPNNATGVILTNALTTNVTFVSVATTQGSCTNEAGIVRCNLGTVASGVPLDVTLVILPNAIGTLTTRAGVTRAEPDGDSSNNQATAVTMVTLPSLSINDVTVTEGNSGTNFVDFIVTLTPASTNTVSVNYVTANGSAASSSDYVSRSGTVTFPPGSTNQPISIGVRGDVLYENTENFFVNLNVPINAIISDNQGVGTILNDDEPPTVSVTDVNITEGNSGTNNAVFRVYLSTQNGLATSINYTTSNGTARAGTDFIGRSGTLTFAPGSAVLTQSVTIQVLGDTLTESNEFFYLQLTSVSNAVLSKAQGIGTIINDEGVGVMDHFEWSAIPSLLQTNQPLEVSITAKDFFGTTITNFNGSVNLKGAIGEPQIDTNMVGNPTVDGSDANGVFTIGYAFTPSSNLRVTHLRHYLGTKVSIWTDNGMLLASQTVTGSGGWTETALSVPLELMAGTTYRLSFYTGSDGYAWTTNYPVAFDHGTIGDSFFAPEDAFPNTFIGSGTLFLVDLRYTVGVPQVPIAIQPAISGAFVDGSWAGSITVLQRGRHMHLEADDGTHLGQSNPFDAGFALEADLALSLSNSPPAVAVSNLLTSTLMVDNLGPIAATGLVLSNIVSGNGTFVSATPSQGSCTNAGNTVICNLGSLTNAGRASVTILSRATASGSMTNRASIVANEPDPDATNNSVLAVTATAQPAISIADSSINEGDAGTNDLSVAVLLWPPVSSTVTVNFVTVNGSASSSAGTGDYISRSGTLTFPPGSTNQVIAIGIRGDTTYETNETFFINLSVPVNAILADNQAVCTILNDDPIPSVFVSDVTVGEGNSATTNAVFRVRLSSSSAFPVIVTYATSNGTAVAGSDYTARSGSLTFSAGTTLLTQTVTIQVIGDLVGEADEVFYLNLLSASNAVLADFQGTATILNDELGGDVSYFAWSAIPDPQFVNQPFPVTIRAIDAFDNAATNFTGVAVLSGLAFGGPGYSLLGSPVATDSNTVGGLTMGYAFVPNTNLLVTHVRHYSGTKVSIWSDVGARLAAVDVISVPGTWVETALTRPIQLLAANRYRVSFYTGTNSAFGRLDMAATFAHGRIEQAYSGVGDVFPTGANAWRLPFVDLRYVVGQPAPITVTPAVSGNFVNGVWMGNLTVAQSAKSLLLRADDTNGHSGLSQAFDVSFVNDISISMLDSPDPAGILETLAYSIVVQNSGPLAATGVRVTDALPPSVNFVSADSSQGTISQGGGVVTGNLGSLAGGASATVTIRVIPTALGRITNAATVTRNEADADVSDNTAVAITTVLSPIVNGSFETGNFSGWITNDLSPPFFPLAVATNGITPEGFGFFRTTPTDGRYAAVHGFDGNGPGRIRIAQDIFVPSATPVLAFDYRAAWSYSGNLPRIFLLSVEPVGGGSPLFTTNILVAPLNMNTSDTGPLEGAVDLGNFGGRSVRVSFDANIPESFTGPAFFQLDNVRLTRGSGGPPFIVSEPTDQSALSGENVTFAVNATGTQPLSYQWQFNGVDIAGATKSTLLLTNVTILNAGGYSVTISNSLGSVRSRVATLTLDESLVFRIIELRTNGFVALEHNNLTGDDRGGIAVSSSSVFYTGDESTARWGLETLSGGTRLNRQFDALVSDLRSEKIYSLANGNDLISATNGLNVNAITSLIEIDGQAGTVTGNRINLSSTVPLGFDTGIFAGYGRIVLHTGGEAYDIALPSGRVTYLGTLTFFQHNSSENWAYWGIAEYSGSALSLLYVQNPQDIVRTRVPDGLTSVAAHFSNLSDMAAISFSTSLSRWYFHHEGTSQFRSGDETIGSAKALFTTDPGFPSIILAPQRQTNHLGSTITFTVVAAGRQPLSYQWRFNGVPIEGANSDMLVLPNVQPVNAGNYSVEVSNSSGAIVSPDAALVLITAPIILVPPAGQTSYPGSNAVFSVTADGAPPLSYQWRFGTANILNATNATLVLTNLQTTQAGGYSVRVANSFGAVTSLVAQLVIRTRPVILAQPQTQTAFGGSNVLFSVTVDGATPLFYQWRLNGTNIAGATNRLLLLTNLQPADAGTYSVQVANAFGLTNSANAGLTVLSIPIIVQQPFNVTTLAGLDATLEVTVTGAPPLAYQWFFGDSIISNANTSTLLITNVQQAQAGTYRLRITNSYGTVISSNAVLTVLDSIEDGTRFQITALLTSGSRVVDHDALTGDDRGGVAASSTHVFVTGDNNTARFSLTDLSGGVVVGTTRDGMVADLRSETVYLLGNGTNILTFGGGTVTTLIELNNLGVPTGRRINLSTPVRATGQFGDQVGLFSGFGRVVIANSSRVYNISIPSGIVIDLGAMGPLDHQFTESWAYWGVAENFDGHIYLDRVRDSQTIVRTRVPDQLTTNLATFNNLSDMASFTVSIPRRRWYFHHEGSSQFGGTSETLGYANATFKVGFADHFEWGPIAPFQNVNVPFNVTLTARNETNGVVTNFDGIVTLSGSNIVGGSSVPILPTAISNFVNGVWTGQVTVLQPSPGMYLRADDGNAPATNSSQFSVSPPNDLLVWINDAPDPALVGGNITYSIVVTNNGPTTSTGVLLTNTLPSSLIFVSVTASQGSCTNAAGVIRCNLDTIPGGVAAEVTVVVTASALGTVVSQATVSRNEPDPSPSNNSATASTLVSYPALSIQDLSVLEGNSGTNEVTFTVVLSAPSTNTVTVNFVTANGTATSASGDYVFTSGSLSFPPGTTNQPLVVRVRGDMMHELDETFLVNLSAPVFAVLGDAQGVCTILNDDPLPSVSVTDVTINEGNSGTNSAVFRVSLSGQSGLATVINYATSNGTATAGTDYIPRSGTLNFLPGTALLTQTVTIQILGDVIPEHDETFFLNLTSASNAIIAKAQGVGTIVNEDGMGILDHFEWATIPSPQQTNVPFAVRITAKDFFGATMSNFNSNVSLRGRIGTEMQTNLFGDAAFTNTFTGDFTIGHLFTVKSNLTVTHVRHYCGSKISLWTERGALLFSQPVFSLNGTWLETALPAPVQLTAGERYRLAFYTGGTNSSYFWDFTQRTNFEHLVLDTGIYAFGDAYPTNETSPGWAVDLSYTVQTLSPPVAITPTISGNFSNGVWNGAVQVLENTTNLVLIAEDAMQHRGQSVAFDVLVGSESDLAVSVSAAPNPVSVGSNYLYTITVMNWGPAAAFDVTVSNQLPADVALVSVLMSQGTWTNQAGWLIGRLGTLGNRASGIVAVTLRPDVMGMRTNYVGVTSAQTDPNPANNTALSAVMVYLDTDGDGIWDDWENQYRLDPNDPSDALVDLDGDGHQNWQEFLAGTDPHDPSSVLRITRLSMSGNDVRIAFRGVRDKRYRLQRLEGGQWSPSPVWTDVMEFKVGAVPNVELIDTGGADAPSRFYRIRLIP
jgi:uncharacterized repeat protein (TIGR01451 family)